MIRLNAIILILESLWFSRGFFLSSLSGFSIWSGVRENHEKLTLHVTRILRFTKEECLHFPFTVPFRDSVLIRSVSSNILH